MNFKRQFLSREAAGELWPLPGMRGGPSGAGPPLAPLPGACCLLLLCIPPTPQPLTYLFISGNKGRSWKLEKLPS